MEASLPYPALTPLQRLFRLLGQYRREIRYVVLYAVVIGLINLSLPLGVQAIIGLLLGGGISASWGVLVFFILVGASFVGFLRLMQLSIMEYLQRRIFADSAVEFSFRIPRLNLEHLRYEHVPELVNRFFDTLNIQKGLPKLLIEGSTALLQIIFSVMLLSFYHVSFVTFSVILLAILILLFFWTAPKGIQTSLLESKYKYKLAYWLEEVGRTASTFKLAGENRFPLKRADELTASYLDARARHWRILLFQFGASVAFRVLVLGSFLILGSLLVMNNNLNIGQFVAAEILVLFIVDSVEKLILLHETGYDVLTATEKLGQVTDLPLERQGGLKVEEFCQGQPFEIELRNLSYHYDEGQSTILNNITLHIKPRERVAVAGYNASGKSTLMQVLSVLKREFTGSYLINGLPKSNLDLRSLRDHIGDFTSQEEIFKGSLIENISLGREGVATSHIVKIIDQVGLTEFIQQLPEGLNTELLPGGKNLPGSIISKIILARAIAGQPYLLVAEEPVGNLNFRDRVRIAKLLTDGAQPWTLVAVTQDPLFAAMCDRVVVMREGEIIAQGTFDEIRQTEHYPRIFRIDYESLQSANL